MCTQFREFYNVTILRGYAYAFMLDIFMVAYGFYIFSKRIIKRKSTSVNQLYQTTSSKL